MFCKGGKNLIFEIFSQEIGAIQSQIQFSSVYKNMYVNIIISRMYHYHPHTTTAFHSHFYITINVILTQNFTYLVSTYVVPIFPFISIFCLFLQLKITWIKYDEQIKNIKQK